VVIVITGPIASGKSTIAQALARELEQSGVRAAVIDLDLVHDALPETLAGDDSSWTVARRNAAATANLLAADGVTVVIAEGSFNSPDDRSTFARDLRSDRDPLYVTLQVSFEEALRRALRDPTRGRSRDPEFLGAHFDARRDALANPPTTDIVIDTERTTATAAAATIARLAGLSASDPGTDPPPPTDLRS
jgi:adenylylsulfate kinase-like enzyme